MINRLPRENEFIEQKLAIMDPLRYKISRRSNTHQIQAYVYLWGNRIGEKRYKRTLIILNNHLRHGGWGGKMLKCLEDKERWQIFERYIFPYILCLPEIFHN